ncbi:MAG: hypothetical protein WC323_00580 [Patescibacteria group bacterium]|jgi:hypothetical protein
MLKNKLITRIFIVAFCIFFGWVNYAQADISLTIFNTEEHPMDKLSQMQVLEKIMPEGTEIEYLLDYKDYNRQKMLRETGARFFPLIVYGQGIENDKDFTNLIKSGLAEKQGSRYVVPAQVIEDIFGAWSYFYQRQPIENRLDLFVASADSLSVGVEKRIINYLLQNKVDDIDLKTHYLVQFPENESKDNSQMPSARYGQPELEENIRQLYIQKNYPDIFYNYLLSVNKDNFLEPEERIGKFDIDYSGEQKEKFKEEALKILRQDSQLADELGIKASPTILWQNQYLIKGYLPFLNKFPPFDKEEKIIKLSADAISGDNALEFFYSRVDNESTEIRNGLIGGLKIAYSKELKIKEYDVVSNPDSLERIIELGEAAGLLAEPKTPVVYFANNLILGSKAIDENLGNLVIAELGEPEAGKIVRSMEYRAAIKWISGDFLKVIKSWSWLLLLFLFCYLTFLKKPAKRIFLFNLIFIVGVLLGHGLFSLIPAGIEWRFMAVGSKLAGIFAFLLFIFSFCLGVFYLYSYYIGEESDLKQNAFINFCRNLLIKVKQVTDEQIYMLAAITGFLSIIFDLSRQSYLSSVSFLNIISILLIFVLVFFGIIFWAVKIKSFFNQHQNLQQFLLSSFFFAMAVFVWSLLI